jgi:hypothetical protein
LHGKTKKGSDKEDKAQKSNNSIHTYIHTQIQKKGHNTHLYKKNIKGRQNKVFKKVFRT